MTEGIRFVRIKTEFSPTDVCRIVGISKSTLFRWELEDRIPKPKREQIAGVRKSGNRIYTMDDLRNIATVAGVKLPTEIIIEN